MEAFSSDMLWYYPFINIKKSIYNYLPMMQNPVKLHWMNIDLPACNVLLITGVKNDFERKATIFQFFHNILGINH